MAFDPPPTHAVTTSGIAAVAARSALLARLVADDAVELAHHPRIRMRAHHRAQAVVRRLDGGDPVAHRFVDGVLQRAAAAAAPASTSAPSSRMRNTLSAWRAMSTSPM